ncbi:hypothetical protein [Pelagicoccus sp. SDUM812002]|uniref:hypothetical protein n=1 Tax=Pelagicoccus sp. SDUM812002 TaxID=3041266 RepID=UPI00280D12AF|nr:hypothetical protein [Pelagicoccus sp. SDUM812002]MDQ8184096.1 hypothetical protein [Pelagicoccus sp. SDUM812002]
MNKIANLTWDEATEMAIFCHGRGSCGRGFAYYDPKGGQITDAGEIKCFNVLAAPPAYRDMWLCLAGSTTSVRPAVWFETRLYPLCQTLL